MRVSSLILSPADLLDPQGFNNGMLCQATRTEVRPSAGLTELTTQEVVSTYPKWSNFGSSRHLLRYLINGYLLPLFPWASEMVLYQEPNGSPVRLWLYDAEGCPLRSREQEVRKAGPVLLGFEELCSAVDAVYPLTTPAQVRLYDALGLPSEEHEKALLLVAPFCGLEDDVLMLAADLYVNTHSGKPLGTPPVTDVDTSRNSMVLEIANRLFDVVASARSLVN
jgi:hypothetical protein